MTKWVALALALADRAARALCAELSTAEMRDICASAWLVALGRGQPRGPLGALSNLVLCEQGSADPQLSWLVTASLKQTQRNLGLPLRNSHIC